MLYRCTERHIAAGELGDSQYRPQSAPFTQQPDARRIPNTIGRPYPTTPQKRRHPAGTMVVTNSAYGTYAIAPEAIATIYGSNLASGPVQASVLPLPTMLGGITVNLKDATGATCSLPLIYVSPNQVNGLIPKPVS